MISYDPGTWGVVGVIFRISGSVFPKALAWAIPGSILAVLLNLYVLTEGSELSLSLEGIDKAWAGYSSVLGFLIVFRNNQAYARFWEGVSLTQQVRGEWFIAISNIFAFCSRDTNRSRDVKLFKQLMVRLLSLLHCTALQQICELDDDTLEVINLDSIDPRKIKFLKSVPDPPELMITWIQRTIVLASDQGIVDIAPPILSRAFQELARGQVNLMNCQKLKRIPFPFPYAQMITGMLLVHWVMTALLSAQLIRNWWCAGMICAFVTCAFWSLFYIAMEIDQPFGSDANDLPVDEIQRKFNETLLMLLDPESADPPSLISDPSLGTPVYAYREHRSSEAHKFSTFSSDNNDEIDELIDDDNFERQLTPGARKLTTGQEYTWGVRSRCSIKSHVPIEMDKDGTLSVPPEMSEDSRTDRLLNTDVLAKARWTTPQTEPDETCDEHPIFHNKSEKQTTRRTQGLRAQQFQADSEASSAPLGFSNAAEDSELRMPVAREDSNDSQQSLRRDEDRSSDEKPHVPSSEQAVILPRENSHSDSQPPPIQLGATGCPAVRC